LGSKNRRDPVNQGVKGTVFGSETRKCGSRMGLNILLHKQKLAALISFLPALFLLLGSGLAAEPDQAAKEHQVEAVVIHVDQYAVYGPNLIFYFDPQMDKKKAASLARAANQLRNRKATIVYWETGDPGQGTRAVLADLYPAGEKRERKTARDAPAPAPAQNNQATSVVPPEDRAAQPSDLPVEQQDVSRLRESKEKKATDKPASITREQITSFIRDLLDLNGRKDLAAIMPFYADIVNYYDRGVVDKDYISRDLGYYYRNWDTINTSLDGEVVVIVLDPEVRVAKFVTSYSVGNSKKSLAGKVENIWKIERINGKLKLVDVKQSKAVDAPSKQ